MPDRLDPYVDRFDVAFSRVLRSISARHGPATAPLSGSQRIVLKTLATQGKAQVSEVAGALDVTLSAATGLIDRLVKAQFVTRERDTEDRRVVWVHITPEGEQVLAEAEARRRLVLREMLVNLNTTDIQTLLEIFDRMVT